MPTLKRLRWTADIAAPASKVCKVMIGTETYKHWTSAFFEGSYFDGSWEKGQRIRFLGPSGDGLISEIAENRPGEFISIRHLGYIANGVEDTSSESIRAWTPAYENYTFAATPTGTTLTIDQDVTDAFESDMVEAWPKALAKLKALCEAGAQ
jgi:hypothetical protein